MATEYDLRIDQGADFGFDVTWTEEDGTPIPLAAARMMIRRTYNSPTPMLSMEDGDGKITLDGPAGHVLVAIPAADTGSLEQGVYDLEVDEVDGTVVRLLMGQVFINPEVTR